MDRLFDSTGGWERTVCIIINVLVIVKLSSRIQKRKKNSFIRKRTTATTTTTTTDLNATKRKSSNERRIQRTKTNKAARYAQFVWRGGWGNKRNETKHKSIIVIPSASSFHLNIYGIRRRYTNGNRVDKRDGRVPKLHTTEASLPVWRMKRRNIGRTQYVDL